MRMDLLKSAFPQSERRLSTPRRTPRSPVIQPRPSEGKPTDINDVERWIGRLSRHIRLQREAERFGRIPDFRLKTMSDTESKPESVT